jgi:hypothetical protein
VQVILALRRRGVGAARGLARRPARPPRAILLPSAAPTLAASCVGLHLLVDAASTNASMTTADHAPDVHPVTRSQTPKMKTYRTQTISSAKIAA